MDDQVGLDEPGGLFVLVPGFADRDRVPQQRPGSGRGDPFGLAASLVGFRSRSIVAPETCISCTRTAGVSLFVSSSPKASSLGSHSSMVAARYFPDGIPAIRHTPINTFSVS